MLPAAEADEPDVAGGSVRSLAPLGFGAVTEYVGFAASWLMMAAMAIMGAGAILLSQKLRRVSNRSGSRAP